MSEFIHPAGSQGPGRQAEGSAAVSTSVGQRAQRNKLAGPPSPRHMGKQAHRAQRTVGSGRREMLGSGRYRLPPLVSSLPLQTSFPFQSQGGSARSWGSPTSRDQRESGLSALPCCVATGRLPPCTKDTKDTFRKPPPPAPLSCSGSSSLPSPGSSAPEKVTGFRVSVGHHPGLQVSARHRS